MSRFFHDCAPWRTEVWFNFGNWWFPYNLVWKHFISFLSLRTVSVITQAPCGLGTCSSPTTCSSNRKGLRSVLICHHQTFDSQVPSCWQLVINSVDNDWVRDESNYNLWPGSPQSCCCCCCCSGVLLPTAVWLSAWLLCISCCCSWAGQSKKSRERVKQGLLHFFFSPSWVVMWLMCIFPCGEAWWSPMIAEYTASPPFRRAIRRYVGIGNARF